MLYIGFDNLIQLLLVGTVPYLLLTDPSAVQVCVLSPENVQVSLLVLVS